MTSRSSSRAPRRPAGTEPARGASRLVPLASACLLLVLSVVRPASAGDAPAWMHALLNAPLPAHDEKTDAVLLYSEKTVTVRSADKIDTVFRRAYKVLRPGGRDYGTVVITFDSQTHIKNLRGWCIPAQGKDYEVKDKDAVEVALPAVPGSELIVDIRAEVLRIPAPDPGNIIGFEYEQEGRPYFLQDAWYFQSSIPVRQATYSLRLPAGWEYKATWLNAPQVAPASQPNGQWAWTVNDVKALLPEDSMPPAKGIEGQMIVSILAPPGTEGAAKFSDWNSIGKWYNGLLRGRTAPSPEMKQKVAELTASLPTPLDKMRALASFVQRSVRYVAIELGIGGYQPHPAADVFANRYGDCKDKATLMRALLGEIDVTSYPLVINIERGSVTPAMPGDIGAFDHEVVAIRLPETLQDPSLVAVLTHPKLGRLLIFDPTNDLIPFGQLSGDLQASYALLVTPDGGELIETPRLPAAANSIDRTARFLLDSFGNLSGRVDEVRRGDFAASQRDSFRSVTLASDRIKPVESLLSRSLSAFRITRASITNVDATAQPVEFDYSFIAEQYAKRAGNLLLVRPRVIGSWSSSLLETKEPRRQPVVFEGPERRTDRFEITLPPGYVVEDLPPPVNLDYSFAGYHSKSEAKGNTLVYSRTLEIKELTVTLSQIEQLRSMYRVIAGDERGAAILKPGP